MHKEILDHGYIKLVLSWGCDEDIVEAARMSTGKGFKGWGDRESPGDERLLAYLYRNKHATPFEMCGFIVEVKAPLFVFREWQRHRTQCLAPDTLVHFERQGKNGRRYVYKMRIEDVWKKWQPTVRRSRPERQTNAFSKRQRIQGMLLRRMNEETQEIEYTRVVNVIKGSPKPMVRVTTTGGRSIVATREHRFVTNRGWDTLGNAIDKNLLLAVEGTTRDKVERRDVPKINEETERWRDIIGWEGLYEVSDQGRIRSILMRQGVRDLYKPKKTTVATNGYDVVSLSRRGKTSTYMVHRLVLEAFEGPCPPGHETRHLDGNRAHNHLENLTWGTTKENACDRIRHDSQQRLVTVFEHIANVEYVGELPTYDLSVEGPYHNFIADGFVVHNSFNELSARYVPVPNENYMPSMERVVDGASETANKQAIGTSEFNQDGAAEWLDRLDWLYQQSEEVYRQGLASGVSKELARLAMPVARYSRMRASANLRNWLGFLTLRQEANAQWEIRQYADAIGQIVAEKFPRTWELYLEGRSKAD